MEDDGLNNDFIDYDFASITKLRDRSVLEENEIRKKERCWNEYYKRREKEE